MAKSKSTPEKRAAALHAARKAGGNNEQPNWLDRLKAVMKRRTKAEKK
jgi:hypothetical protein